MANRCGSQLYYFVTDGGKLEPVYFFHVVVIFKVVCENPKLRVTDKNRRRLVPR
jgi:hypothetical protein